MKLSWWTQTLAWQCCCPCSSELRSTCATFSSASFDFGDGGAPLRSEVDDRVKNFAGHALLRRPFLTVDYLKKRYQHFYGLASLCSEWKMSYSTLSSFITTANLFTCCWQYYTTWWGHQSFFVFAFITIAESYLQLVYLPVLDPQYTYPACS